jgi:hypothetical protein
MICRLFLLGIDFLLFVRGKVYLSNSHVCLRVDSFSKLRGLAFLEGSIIDARLYVFDFSDVVVCRLLDNFVDCSTVIDVNKVERPLQH